ncbi:MAG: 23S rRNA (guanosine(2251)-2'-O)-methyltransferase RlmB [Alphaproteobacteria bacterium]|nr:23S rRNA (guanosine(2251)-2'-O)-methyltransferase RlmB [Alphaproteobacteria bacterium]
MCKAMKNMHTKTAQTNLYGFHAVREAWLNPARNVQALYVTEQAKSGFEAVLREAQKKGLRRPAPTILDKKALEKMLPSGAVHQGLALAASDGAEFSEHDLMIATRDKGEALILMLDQVTDPHNVGAILRSACALGADGVVMQKKHAPALNGVLAKTACGAVEHIPVAFVTNLSRTLEEFKDNGFFVYGLDERGERTIGEVNSSKGKAVLVLGAEGPGLRYLVKEHCDELVRLPTGGPIASLNVSNAAAVALYAFKA